MKQDPLNPNTVIYKDANGKTVRKPKPADFDAVKSKQKGEILNDFLESMLPWWMIPSELNKGEDEQLDNIRRGCP